MLKWVFLLVVFALPHNASAHFEHLLSRIVHVTQEDQGLRVYSRIPLALALLPQTWEGVDVGQDLDHIATEKVEGVWRYYVDHESVRNSSTALAGNMIDAFDFSNDTQHMDDFVFDGLRVYAFSQRPSFNTLKKASTSFQEGGTAPANPPQGMFGAAGASRFAPDANQPIEVFDAVVDISFFIPDASLSAGLKIESQLGNHLPIINQVVNIVLFHDADGEVIQTTAGVLNASLEQKPNSLDQIVSQGISGIRHIFIGIDHILFILLLLLAATTWLDVLKKATTFTVGLSITLVIGVIGYTPTGTWFIPFVETAIAASIVYAGISIIANQSENFSGYKIFFIGLLHGFGLSFVLNEVLLEPGTINVANLLGFNLGIEFGQLIILSVVGPLVYLIDKYWLHEPAKLRRALSLPCVLIAAFWVLERGMNTLQVASY